ncbi:hypothetical protein [Legionella jordanis]|uniref:Uncharacterized protein n=1 Tax=Legionella jordanis TaxID=456 RepID=A0A0W0VAF9_9GAMM|nr:hypothetical protein [Legionella jordanis]KTD17116.1 hypothetical protein Ljor_1422 [Legionella jordanis]RMX03247.1 hypothetical protein EAW55_07410 [Legionella jordanis]RMX18225.1 hypothetical protein EAS68_08945 [Legionella jordanis]VEH12687.1 Uncharacterised protein [Legionella jordanis]HAT8713164.1 hypothetical protein [Legionella jordanis]
MRVKTEMDQDDVFNAKLERFWSHLDSDFNNVKRVLQSYCLGSSSQRNLSIFHPRSNPNALKVSKMLANADNPKATDLLTLVNETIKNFADDYSLLHSLQFICQKLRIPYVVVNREEEVLLDLMISELALTRQATDKQTTSVPFLEEKLLASYKRYNLLPTFNNSQDICMEDNDYTNVELLQDPKQLHNGTTYLYVITETGHCYFAPQRTQTGKKLTHSGLLRKALDIKNGTTPPVLAAGAIAKTDNNFLFNLASGHFEPEACAYGPALECLAKKLINPLLLIQTGYSNTHYKSLDQRYGVRIDVNKLEISRQLRLNLLAFMENTSNMAVQEVSAKIFREINSAGTEFNESEEVTFSSAEVEEAFNNKQFEQFVNDHLDYCPASLQEQISIITSTKDLSMKMGSFSVSS